jgi:GAF domain-containing protein
MSAETLREYVALFDEKRVKFSCPISVVQEAWERLQTGETIVESDSMSRVVAALLPEERPVGEWIQAHSRQGSALLAPLTQGAKTIGGISIVGERVGASDIPAVTLFARHVSVALENARLFAETRQRLAELEAVNKVSTALRAARSLDEMLSTLLEATLSVLNVAAATIWLYDPAKDELRQVAERAFPHIATPLKPLDVGFPPLGDRIVLETSKLIGF